MNPILSKLLPWAISAVLAGGLLFSFAKYEQAKGAAKAHLQSANALQAEYTRDSTAWAKAQRERQHEADSLKRQIIVATTKQHLAARKADSLTAELAPQLPDTLKPKLEAIQAAHAQERAQWAIKETQYAARIRLMQADSAETAARVAGLERINRELHETLQAGIPHQSFGAKVLKVVVPAVVGAGIAAGAIAALH